MTKELDLTKMNGMGPIAVSSDSSPRGPTVHLTWKKPYDLPKEGSATVKFKVRRTSHDADSDTYEVTLELLSLSNISGTKKVVVKPDTETSDALDGLRNQKMAESEDEEDEYEEEED